MKERSSQKEIADPRNDRDDRDDEEESFNVETRVGSRDQDV